MGFKVNNLSINSNFVPTINVNPPAPVISEPVNYNLLKNSVSEWILAVLKTATRVRVAPTLGSRFYFLAGSIIYDALVVSNDSYGSFDMFSQLPNLRIGVPATQSDVWIELCAYNGLVALYNKFGYTTTELIATRNEHQITYPTVYEQMGNYSSDLTVWIARVNAYLNLRWQDGFQAAGTFNPNSTTPATTFPNPTVYISTDPTVAVTQDLNILLPEPTLWTHLDVVYDGTSHLQGYLTPEWGSVTGIISDTDKDTLITRISENFYPSDEVLTNEIQAVLDLSKNLTIKDKVNSEFWAGGPGTVTPPGFWMLFATYTASHYGISTIREINLFKQMGTGVFQAGILAWRLKRVKLQQRPIQAIRKLPETTVTTWSGTISSKAWLPYQETNFVTPPFPDFVSGHSTFSGIGSKILTNFFGTNVIPDGRITLTQEQMLLLSPIFTKCDSECSLSEITVYPSTSDIQSSIPPTGVCLNFVTWDQMADAAGISRVTGGIHYESSNQAGLALGRNLFNYIR